MSASIWELDSFSSLISSSSCLISSSFSMPVGTGGSETQARGLCGEDGVGGGGVCVCVSETPGGAATWRVTVGGPEAAAGGPGSEMLGPGPPRGGGGHSWQARDRHGRRGVRDAGPGTAAGGWEGQRRRGRMGVRDAGPGESMGGRGVRDAAGRTGAPSLLQTGSRVCRENRLLNENETVMCCLSSHSSAVLTRKAPTNRGNQLGVMDPHKGKGFIFSKA